ncbi:MAG: hypothetical protein ACO1OQ_03915 [Rufibacter sp.]
MIYNSYYSFLIGFLASCIYAALLFYPHTVAIGQPEALIIVFLYGYAWLLPIVVLFLVLPRLKNRVRKIFLNNTAISGLLILAGLSLIESRTTSSSNDSLLNLEWGIAGLIWLATYFRLKRKTTHKNI